MPSQTTQAAHSAPAPSREGLALTTTISNPINTNTSQTGAAQTGAAQTGAAKVAQKPGAVFDTLASIVSGARRETAQTDRLRAALIEALS